MLLTKLIEIEDAFEMREAPALLEPSLFRDTNKISLPRQVNPLTEDNLKNALWYALEEFEVYGEVNLGKGFGRIDLLCEHSDVRVGMECKKLLEKEKARQLRKYIDSGCQNALYLVSLAMGDYEIGVDIICARIEGRDTFLETIKKGVTAKITDEVYKEYDGYRHEHRHLVRGELPPAAAAIQQRLPEIWGRNYPEILKGLRRRYNEGIDLQAPYGIILYNPLGEMWVAKGGELLGEYTSSSYSPTKEAFIKFSVWRFLKNKGHIITSESKLSNVMKEEKLVRRKKWIKTKNYPSLQLWRLLGYDQLPIYNSKRVITGHDKIDVTTMPKSDINETNPSNLEITGVECKPSTSKKSLSDLETQLPSYQNSGDLSLLYVAVPRKYERKIKEFLKEQRFTDVGLLIVGDKGKVEEIKEAKELEMKKPYFFSIEKRRLKDGKFRERIYTKASGNI